MKNIFAIIFICMIFISCGKTQAQSPQGKDFGFGVILGEPTGGTLKFWTGYPNAFVVDIGSSYFGSVRVGVDYLWHFEAFKSDVAELYAGPGGVIGFGKGKGFWYRSKEGFLFREGNDVGIGIRGLFGVNIVPRRTPLEMFFEIGALIGFVPDFGSGIDAAVGIRFYP